MILIFLWKREDTGEDYLRQSSAYSAATFAYFAATTLCNMKPEFITTFIPLDTVFTLYTLETVYTLYTVFTLDTI